MRSFDYTQLADRTWDNEILSYISKIYEYSLMGCMGNIIAENVYEWIGY